jgi:hypothetical protein
MLERCENARRGEQFRLGQLLDDLMEQFSSGHGSSSTAAAF